MPEDVKPVQRSVLLILMAAAREVANAELTNDWKLKLEKARRDDLAKQGLIKVRKDNNRLYLDLTDVGAVWCRRQHGDQVPAGMGHGGAAAYAMLAGIQRHLDRTGTSLPEFFARFDESLSDESRSDESRSDESRSDESRFDRPAALAAPDDLEVRIRKAYQELASGPGSWVKLADLRPMLGGPAGPAVDRALVALNSAPDVSIVPESDQKTLTAQDRAAAVRIGNQDKHLIAIGQS